MTMNHYRVAFSITKPGLLNSIILLAIFHLANGKKISLPIFAFQGGIGSFSSIHPISKSGFSNGFTNYAETICNPLGRSQLVDAQVRNSFSLYDMTDRKEREVDRRASVSLSGIPSAPSISSTEEPISPTIFIDYILSLLTSDVGSIILGLGGMLISLYNRLSSIDYEASLVISDAADAMGQQSRSDLLAVFASGAVLLNGISKLDVTSALAESVILEGMKLSRPKTVNIEVTGIQEKDDLIWSVESALIATPAKTAVLLIHDDKGKWIPSILGGIIPFNEQLQNELPKGQSTPILDRFLTQKGAKESYLPTLQALPGKVEFTFLPPNSQEALLLPVILSKKQHKAVLVLGSDTAKNFTPRDIAWCQVLASRIGTLLFE